MLIALCVDQCVLLRSLQLTCTQTPPDTQQLQRHLLVYVRCAHVPIWPRRATLMSATCLRDWHTRCRVNPSDWDTLPRSAAHIV
jgi:hypothetical protein